MLWNLFWPCRCLKGTSDDGTRFYAPLAVFALHSDLRSRGFVFLLFNPNGPVGRPCRSAQAREGGLLSPLPQCCPRHSVSDLQGVGFGSCQGAFLPSSASRGGGSQAGPSPQRMGGREGFVDVVGPSSLAVSKMGGFVPGGPSRSAVARKEASYLGALRAQPPSVT
jgi:hypothetical protein